MSEHVYHVFSKDDVFHTEVLAQPLTVVESGSGGWSGNQNGPSGSLSLYGGLRARSDVFSGSLSGLQVYPIDVENTYSIEKVVGIPGAYPATGSIRIVSCTSSVATNFNQITPTQWHQEHFSPINGLFSWYHDHVRSNYGTGSVALSNFRLVHVPSMFYGRSIATGSVLITDRSYDNVSGTLRFVDDGLGTLIISGSDITSKVGNVFYDYGLIVFTNAPPAFTGSYSFGSGAQWSGTNPLVHIEFRGNTVIKSWVFMCRLGPGEANASDNSTYWSRDSLGRKVAKGDDPENVTYVTAIGLYNEERQLVAVAKIAQPIRKRERDKNDIRLRMDM